MMPAKVQNQSELDIQTNIVKKSFLLSLLAFLVVILIAWFAWNYTSRHVRDRQQFRFSTLSAEMAILIENRIQSYVSALYGAQRLFAASKSVERNEWKAFVGPDNLAKHFPGIAAMRFIERVPAEGEAKFVEEVKSDTSVRSQGYPDFRIKNYVESDIVKVRPEKFIIKYAEPFEANEKMLGFDVSSDESRWRTYEQSWVTGEPGVIHVTRYQTQRPGFIIIYPIYQNGMPTFSVQERQKAHIGFVDAVFNTAEFFQSMFGKDQIFSQIYFEILNQKVDKIEGNEKKIVFQSWLNEPADRFRKLGFSGHRVIKILNDDWTIFFYASKDFGASEVGKETPQIVFFGGVLLGFLLWIILYTLSTARFRAVMLAGKITKDLRESEEKFRAITHSAAEAIISMNIKGNIVFWNQGAVYSFGYTETEILNSPITSIIPAWYQDSKLPDYEGFFSRLVGRTNEAYGRRKNGTEFPAEISIATWKKDEELFFTIILRDISERKKIEHELELNRNRYAKLLNEAPDPIVTFDEFGYIQSMNKAAEAASGYSQSGVVGKHISEVHFVLPDSIQKMKDEFSALIAKSERLPYEMQIITASGQLKTFEANPRLITDKDKIEAIQIIFRDLTERKKAEKREAIEHSIVRLIASADTLKSASSEIIRLMCKELSWSGGAFWLINSTMETMSCIEKWFTKNELQVSAHYAKAYKKGEGMPGKVWERNDFIWACNMDSKGKAYSSMMFPIGSHDEVFAVAEFIGENLPEPEEGLLKMFKAIGSQISQFIQRKIAEEELAKAQGTLLDREKSAMVAQLAAGVAHEVKNPLSILLQGAEHFKQNGKLKTEDAEIIDVMINAVERADRIIKGLLELSRPDSLHVKTEDINSVIETCLLLVKNQLDKKSITVTKNLKKISKVAIDRGKVEEIFINVFTNSIDAMEPGSGAELIVRTREVDHADNKAVLVEVEDTGSGIPDTLLPKIFSPFVTSKRATGGSGLGLPIVRNIMEMHKGQVKIENMKSRGAKVSLIFPI